MEVLHSYSSIHGPSSAIEIVPYIMELATPRTVVDVGCGIAQWLYVFKQYGVESVLGLDGKHVPRTQLMIDPGEFQELDLRCAKEFSPQKKYDLALNLEVAEHIPQENAHDLVELLVSLSDIIVFSAAIPNQTGMNHVNEQPPSYWQGLFASRGYEMLDAFRPIFWDDNRVHWWYRQNLCLVVKREMIAKFDYPPIKHLYVHPGLLQQYVDKVKGIESQLRAVHRGEVGLKLAFGILLRTLVNKLKAGLSGKADF